MNAMCEGCNVNIDLCIEAVPLQEWGEKEETGRIDIPLTAMTPLYEGPTPNLSIIICCVQTDLTIDSVWKRIWYDFNALAIGH